MTGDVHVHPVAVANPRGGEDGEPFPMFHWELELADCTIDGLERTEAGAYRAAEVQRARCFGRSAA